MTKAEGHHAVVPTPIKIMERSVHSAALVFSKLLFRQGLLTGLEHGLLMDHYRHHLADGRCAVDLWVYLRTPAEIAYSGVQKRGRTEEIGVVSLDYLKSLEKQYDQLFLSSSSTDPGLLKRSSLKPRRRKRSFSPLAWLECSMLKLMKLVVIHGFVHLEPFFSNLGLR